MFCYSVSHLQYISWIWWFCLYLKCHLDASLTVYSLFLVICVLLASFQSYFCIVTDKYVILSYRAFDLWWMHDIELSSVAASAIVFVSLLLLKISVNLICLWLIRFHVNREHWRFSSCPLQMNATFIRSRRSSQSSSSLQWAGRPFPTHGKSFLLHCFKEP